MNKKLIFFRKGNNYGEKVPKATGNLILITVIIGLSFFLNSILFAQGGIKKEGAQTKEANTSEKTVSGQKTEEEAPTKEKVEINPEIIEKTMPAYRLNLKQLIEEAERNIKRVEGEIVQAEILERNRAREAKLREHFEKGNAFYQKGKLRLAKKEWKKALEIARHPEMKKYVRAEEKAAKEEELAKIKKEQERKQLKAKQKEKERWETEKQRREELAFKEQERKPKKEEPLPQQARVEKRMPVEAKQKEKERREAEKQRQEELSRRARELRQKQKQVRLEKQRKERELAQKKQELREKIASLYNKAIEYYETSQFNRAKDLFKRILSLDPHQTKAAEYLQIKIPNKINQREFAQQSQLQRLKTQQQIEMLKQTKKLEQEAKETKLKEQRKINY